MKKILPVSILAVLALYMAPKSSCQKILTTIPIGGNAGLLAVNPVTNMIYVPNTILNTVTVIDGSSNRVVTNVPAGLGPVAVAVNTTTNLIYVSNDGGGQLQSPSIIVIDGATNTVVATVPVTAPGFIAVNSVTDMIYFGNGSGASISVLDGSTNEIIDTFATAKCCLIQGIAVNSSTNRIYVTENGFSEQLVVIDGSTNKFSAFPIQGVCDLRGVAVDSAVNRIYVADDICGELYVINGVTNKTIATVSGYFGPLALNPSLGLIADFDFNLLGFLNDRTYAVTGGTVNFPVSLIAQNVAANNSNRYYVTFHTTNGIAVVSGP